jgi:hypothetical protein
MKFIFLVDSTEQCAKSQGGLIFIKLKLVNESEVTDENGKNYSLSHLIIYEDKNKGNGVYQKFLSLKREIERLKSSSPDYEDLQEKATVDLKIANEKMLDLESDEEEKEEFKKSLKKLVFKTCELCDFEKFAKKLSEGKLSIGGRTPYVEDMVGENCCLLKEGDNEIKFEPFLADEFLTKLSSVGQGLEPEPKKEAKDYLTVFRDYSISASSPAISDDESENYYSPSSEIETAEKIETIEVEYSIISEETFVTREEETIEDSVSKEEKSELTDTEAEVKMFSPVNSITKEKIDNSLAEENHLAKLRSEATEKIKIINLHWYEMSNKKGLINDKKIDDILGHDWKKQLQEKVKSGENESDIEKLMKNWKQKISQAKEDETPGNETIFENASDLDYHESEAEVSWPTSPISDTRQLSYQELNDFNSENGERPPTPPTHKIDWNFWGPVIVAIAIVVIFVIGWLKLRKKEEKTFSY